MMKVEFLIVGQGLAGTMLAFELLTAGIDFRILNDPKKSKASLVAAGMINPLVFKRLTKSWMLDELLPVMRAKYHELEYRLEERFLFDKPILKPLSEQEKELWAERKTNPGFASYIGEITSIAPVGNIRKSAAYAEVKGSGYLKLNSFLKTAESFFMKKNLIIGSEFNGRNGLGTTDKIRIGNIKADKVVYCEGYHLSKNALFNFVKLIPVKGEVLEIYAPHLSEEFILNKKCFVLPVENQRFKVGSTYEWKDLTENTSEKGRISILERLENLIDTNYNIEKHWAGIRPTVSDRRPVLGQHPQRKNTFVFNGLGTKGVMLAPYFAKEMLKFLSSANYILPPEINAQRFV